jgi:hypothetical protein
MINKNNPISNPKINAMYIINTEEFALLRILYSKFYFSANCQKYFLKNGVHQFSALSTTFLNIYFEYAIKKLI